MLIEERACPRCGNRRTMRVRSTTSMCWNCKLQWPPSGSQAEAQIEATFTVAELRRLMAYRAAIAAGLYSDFPG